MRTTLMAFGLTALVACNGGYGLGKDDSAGDTANWDVDTATEYEYRAEEIGITVRFNDGAHYLAQINEDGDLSFWSSTDVTFGDIRGFACDGVGMCAATDKSAEVVYIGDFVEGNLLSGVSEADGQVNNPVTLHCASGICAVVSATDDDGQQQIDVLNMWTLERTDTVLEFEGEFRDVTFWSDGPLVGQYAVAVLQEETGKIVIGDISATQEITLTDGEGVNYTPNAVMPYGSSRLLALDSTGGLHVLERTDAGTWSQNRVAVLDGAQPGRALVYSERLGDVLALDSQCGVHQISFDGSSSWTTTEWISSETMQESINQLADFDGDGSPDLTLESCRDMGLNGHFRDVDGYITLGYGGPGTNTPTL